jgi:hypothetical protein
MRCERCRRRRAEYTSPGVWCLKCWTRWWVDPIPKRKARLLELKRVRRELKRLSQDPQ